MVRPWERPPFPSSARGFFPVLGPHLHRWWVSAASQETVRHGCGSPARNATGSIRAGLPTQPGRSGQPAPPGNRNPTPKPRSPSPQRIPGSDALTKAECLNPQLGSHRINRINRLNKALASRSLGSEPSRSGPAALPRRDAPARSLKTKPREPGRTRRVTGNVAVSHSDACAGSTVSEVSRLGCGESPSRKANMGLVPFPDLDTA